MTELPPGGDLWGARMLGALAGASISLAYFLPRNRQEAAIRFLTGVACGLVFGGPAGLWIATRLDLIAQMSSADTLLAGSAAASLCAWWALGALGRIAARWGGRPADRR